MTCSRASPRSPSITARSWSRARRGAGTARARSSPRCASSAGRWWRTMTATDPEEAQRLAGRVLRRPGRRPRAPHAPTGPRRRSARWPTPSRCSRCRPLPYPATIERDPRSSRDNAAVAFRGNRYSVPPGLAGIRCRAAATASAPRTRGDPLAPPGRCWLATASPRPAPGPLVRTAEHRAALERVVLSAFTTDRPCDRKANRPPGAAALAEAARLLGRPRAATVDRRPGRTSADAGRR